MRLHQTAEYEAAQSLDLSVRIREVKQLSGITFDNENVIVFKEKRKLNLYVSSLVSKPEGISPILKLLCEIYRKFQKPVPVSGLNRLPIIPPTTGLSSISAVYKTVMDLICPPATPCLSPSL